MRDDDARYNVDTVRGIHWRNPLLMLVFFALAVLCALGHHLLYDYLDGRAPVHQQWYLRAGTAFAVFSKILLSASITISFTQRSWNTARTKYLSIGALDLLFGAVMNPLALMKVELLDQAKLALSLTVLIWLTPLITIFTPGSLTTIQQQKSSRKFLPVPTLNMTLDSDAANGNSSAGTLDLYRLDLIVGKQTTYSFDGPSNAALAVVYQTVYQGQIINSESPCGIEDCSFNQTFHAPAYYCEDVNVLDVDSPWCHISKAGVENKTCIMEESGVFRDVMYSAGNGSAFAESNPEVTYNDGKFWIMFRDYDATKMNSSNAVQGYLSSPYRSVSFSCEWWDTEYRVHRSFSGGTQKDIETELQKLTLLPNSMTEGDNISLSYQYATFALRESLMNIFAKTLMITVPQGAPAVWEPPDGLNLAGTNFVRKTPWQKPIDWLPVSDLKDRFEELSKNITLSLFSLSNLAFLRESTTAVFITSSQIVYSYDRRALLVTYGTAVALALMSLTIGLMSFLQNGVSMNIGFLPFLCTTRNSELDAVVGDARIGADGFTDGLKEIKVKFGKVPHVSEYGPRGSEKLAFRVLSGSN